MEVEQNQQLRRQGEEDGGAARGLDQVGVRAFNERVILSLVRQESGLARVEIARRTGLSAQTVSVIIRSLQRDGLLQAGEPIKGKVGQPQVPMSLAPEGAFSLGLKVGRRSVDLALMNFTGEVIDQLSETYAYPLPDQVLRFAKKGAATLAKRLPPAQRGRIVGLGVATPSFLWDWTEKVGARAGEMEVWRDYDLATALERACGYRVYRENDASAACSAELLFGKGRQYSDFLYFFVGSFIGGGLVVGGAALPGARGNAGAVGSMPIKLDNGEIGQLIDVASQFRLEDALRAKGEDPVALLCSGAPWEGFEDALVPWIRETGHYLAQASAAATALIDAPLIVIDGGFPADVKARLVAETEAALKRCDLRGLHPPELTAGEVGANARAVGAASLPIFDQFMLSREDRGVGPAERSVQRNSAQRNSARLGRVAAAS